MSQLREVAFFTAAHETFGGALEFFPAGADLFRFFTGDAVVGGGGSDDGQEIGKFLDHLVGGGDEEMRMGPMGLRVLNEEAAGALTDPLDDPGIFGGGDEFFDAVQWVGGSAPGSLIGFRPFVDHGEGQVEVGGHLLDAGLGEHLT